MSSAVTATGLHFIALSCRQYMHLRELEHKGLEQEGLLEIFETPWLPSRSTKGFGRSISTIFKLLLTPSGKESGLPHRLRKALYFTIPDAAKNSSNRLDITRNQLALTRRARHRWHPARDFLWYNRGIFGLNHQSKMSAELLLLRRRLVPV